MHKKSIIIFYDINLNMVLKTNFTNIAYLTFLMKIIPICLFIGNNHTTASIIRLEKCFGIINSCSISILNSYYIINNSRRKIYNSRGTLLINY